MAEQSEVTSSGLTVRTKRKNTAREYLEAFLTAVLLAFLIRSFVLEPFKIPSKSMVPTLLVGDHIFVNKFAYGLRIPWTTKWFLQWDNPERGEVIVFIYPEDRNLDFIKRVIGVPGDRIQIKSGRLYLNGNEVKEVDLPIVGIDDADKRRLKLSEIDKTLPKSLQTVPFYRGYENFKIQWEQIDQKKFFVQKSRLFPASEEVDITVPADQYFVLGDNRDQSADSRIWGFVPRKNLKGKAMFIWLSLDHDQGGIRLKRFARPII